MMKKHSSAKKKKEKKLKENKNYKLIQAEVNRVLEFPVHCNCPRGKWSQQPGGEVGPRQVQAQPLRGPRTPGALRLTGHRFPSTSLCVPTGPWAPAGRRWSLSGSLCQSAGSAEARSPAPTVTHPDPDVGTTAPAPGRATGVPSLLASAAQSHTTLGLGTKVPGGKPRALGCQSSGALPCAQPAVPLQPGMPKRRGQDLLQDRKP